MGVSHPPTVGRQHQVSQMAKGRVEWGQGTGSASTVESVYREPEYLPWDGRRVPITFVGGYLGAGKTTAINEALVSAERPIAVIVNDAGAVNIDASLIKGTDGDVIELTDGCICCTNIDDMGQALDKIRSRPSPPDQVVIELSGIAEPANAVPWGRSAGFLLDGVVVVVAADQLSDTGLPTSIDLHIKAQIGAADMIVLTKADIVDQQALVEAKAKLAALAPRTPVIDGSLNQRQPGALGRFLTLGGHHERDVAAVPGPTLFDLHQTHTVPIERPVTKQELDAIIAQLPDNVTGGSVVRAKGVVDLLDDSGPSRVLIQVVGERSQVTPLYRNEHRDPTDLVVITVSEDI